MTKCYFCNALHDKEQSGLCIMYYHDGCIMDIVMICRDCLDRGIDHGTPAAGDWEHRPGNTYAYSPYALSLKIIRIYRQGIWRNSDAFDAAWEELAAYNGWLD